MDILKITCTALSEAACHKNIQLTYPNCLSILHEPNNHIIFENTDYDSNGHVKKSKWTKTVKDKLDSSVKAKYDEIALKEFV